MAKPAWIDILLAIQAIIRSKYDILGRVLHM